MTRGPKPDPTSISGKLRAFYAANPDEWLTWDDAAAKFGCTKDQVRWAMMSLRKKGSVRIEVVSVLRLAETP